MGARTRLGGAATVALVLGTVFMGRVWAERAAADVLPHVPAKAPVLFDTRPVPVTVTAFWQKAPKLVTAHDLLTDHTLWRQMHIGDWDKVPQGLRERGLAAMLDHYGPLLTGPRAWIALSVFDWDVVPQPIRGLAYTRMAEYWTGRYDVGAGFAESPELVARTVAAIIMAESWFEHRALNVNEWGNRDLGLAGCSDLCRRILGEMAAEGTLDFVLEDHEYFDPWNGTRVAAVWFGRELVRAEGDLAMAIAAYYRGMPAARRGEGREYAANVARLRRQYIEGHDAPPAWGFLLRESRGYASARGRLRPALLESSGPAAGSLALATVAQGSQ